MLNNIKDTVIVIIVFLLLFVGALLFFITTSSNIAMDSENFDGYLENYSECRGEYDSKTYDDTDIINMSIEEVKLIHEEIGQKTNCSSKFVVSNDEQISDYSYELLPELENYFGNKEFGYIDAIYTAPSRYYADLGIPQQYLFFAMDRDETKLVAIVAKPNLEGGLEHEFLWDIQTAEDLELVQSYVEKLLVKYKEQI